MKITIESQDLEKIAVEIQRNCNLLRFCDEDDVEDSIPYYVGEIETMAADLMAVTRLAKQRTAEPIDGVKA